MVHLQSGILLSKELTFFLRIYLFLLEREHAGAGGGAEGEVKNLQQTPVGTEPQVDPISVRP